MLKRSLAALVLAVIGLPAILVGGLYYYALITILLGIAAWEYGRIFRTAGHNSAEPLLVGGTALVILLRAYLPDLAVSALVLIILGAMTWHLIDYERGRDQAASDFAVTASGIFYVGWIGAYLIDVRVLPDGMWWLLLVFPAVWFADTFAYFIGSRFGRHRLSPRLSPKKSWEGYVGGVVVSIIGTPGLAMLWHRLGGPEVSIWQGALLGAAISILSLLGDLGESMFKRQAGVKDSSNIIPGHGGVLDRMDSWLWAAVIGYFIIVWFFLK